MRMKTSREIAIQCIKDEAEAVLGLIPQLDENFDKAVDLILNCKGKVIVTGVGKSGHIGDKIASTLSSTGTPSFFTNPLDVFHGEGVGTGASAEALPPPLVHAAGRGPQGECRPGVSDARELMDRIILVIDPFQPGSPAAGSGERRGAVHRFFLP